MKNSTPETRKRKVFDVWFLPKDGKWKWFQSLKLLDEAIDLCSKILEDDSRIKAVTVKTPSRKLGPTTLYTDMQPPSADFATSPTEARERRTIMKQAALFTDELSVQS